MDYISTFYSLFGDVTSDVTFQIIKVDVTPFHGAVVDQSDLCLLTIEFHDIPGHPFHTFVAFSGHLLLNLKSSSECVWPLTYRHRKHVPYNVKRTRQAAYELPFVSVSKRVFVRNHSVWKCVPRVCPFSFEPNSCSYKRFCSKLFLKQRHNYKATWKLNLNVNLGTGKYLSSNKTSLSWTCFSWTPCHVEFKSYSPKYTFLVVHYEPSRTQKSYTH